MRKVVFSMTVSADGFIAAPDGSIDWTLPDDEVFRFHLDGVRELGAHFCGRRLYETMLYWEPIEETGPSVSEDELEFARLWRDLPKIVFSKTLDKVEGSNTWLAADGVAKEVARLKARPGKDLAVGGASLAASFMELDLIDEYRIFTYPVILGGGTPYFPPLATRLDLDLAETRTLGSKKVVYTRYERNRAAGEPPRAAAV